jgi:hypothetical protein
VRVSVSTDRPVQVVALRQAASVSVPRAPVVTVAALRLDTPPVAEVVRADQYEQDQGQDDRPPAVLRRSAGPLDRDAAQTVQSWTPTPRSSRDPFEVA